MLADGQVISALKQLEQGLNAKDVCCELKN